VNSLTSSGRFCPDRWRNRRPRWRGVARIAGIPPQIAE